MATHSSNRAWRTHGQRSLASYSPWGHKESDTTEHVPTVSSDGRKSLLLTLGLHTVFIRYELGAY